MTSSQSLDRHGSIATPNGRIVRPLPDADPDPAPEQQRGATLFLIEHEAIHAGSRALARLTARHAEIQQAMYDIATTPAKLAQLRDEAEEVEQARVGDARASARASCLSALEAQATRAAQELANAAAHLADAAARYEATAQLIDRLTGLNRFDPLGAWPRAKIMAPEPRHRPKHLHITPDAWGADCLWTADSAAHRQAVEFHIGKLQSELNAALNGAGNPF